MRRILILILVIILVIAGLLYAFREYENAKNNNHITLYGNVDVRQVDLAFRVSGRVEKLFFEEGDLVLPGQLVAILDKQPYTDQVREASANVESIKVSLQNAEKILQRRQELISDGSVSQEDLDNAIANKEVFAANLKQAEAALAVAITNLKFTEVYAPTEGTVLTRIREPGSVVNPSEPILTLSITSPVWIRAFVNEPELGLVYPGMVADVITDTKGAPAYQGHVGFISPVAEFTPKTVETTQLRSDLVYRLRIYVDNPGRGLRQGMPVTVKLSLHKEAQ